MAKGHWTGATPMRIGTALSALALFFAVWISPSVEPHAATKAVQKATKQCDKECRDSEKAEAARKLKALNCYRRAGAKKMTYDQRQAFLETCLHQQ